MAIAVAEAADRQENEASIVGCIENEDGRKVLPDKRVIPDAWLKARTIPKPRVLKHGFEQSAQALIRSEEIRFDLRQLLIVQRIVHYRPIRSRSNLSNTSVREVRVLWRLSPRGLNGHRVAPKRFRNESSPATPMNANAQRSDRRFDSLMLHRVPKIDESILSRVQPLGL